MKKFMDMTSEEKFLLAGAHNNLDEEGKRRFRSFLSQPLNWADIERKAIQHGIAPLLYFNLRNEDIRHYLPAEVLTKFQVLLCETGFRNILIYEELARILERLEKSGVEVAVVKGAALAWTVYRDAALRPMEDIDLFVPMSSNPALKSVLESCGFFLDMRHSEVIGRIRVDNYQYKEHGLCLDIKYFPDKRIERIWSEKRYLGTSETSIPTLRCEDHLMYLCVHAIKHLTLGFNYLLWLCDINELIRWANKHLDWKFLRNRAKEFHVQHIVYMMLCLSRRLLETPIPDDILKSLRYSVLKERILSATLISPERFLSANKNPRHLQSLFNLVCLLDSWNDIIPFLPYLMRPDFW